MLLSFGAAYTHQYLYVSSAAVWFWQNRPQTAVQQIHAKHYDSFIPSGPPNAEYQVGPEKSTDTTKTNFGWVKE